MPDTTFTASYVTTDAILETYLTNDPRASAIALKAASAAAQGWYCIRATKLIDAIPFQGFKLASTQTLEFPRKYKKSEYDSPWGATITEDAYGYIYDSSSVPQAIIDACAEEAIAQYAFFADSDNVDRKAMKEQGVESYNLGGVYSETLKRSNADTHYGLLSSEAYNILTKYIARSAAIV